MTELEFNTQIGRLSARYPGVYTDLTGKPNEVAKVFFSVLITESADWLRRFIDRWIISSRFAPMFPDFETDLQQLREFRLQKEKEEKRREAAAIFNQDNPERSKDANAFFTVVKYRIRGSVSDEKYTEFMQCLDKPGSIKNIGDPKQYLTIFYAEADLL